MSFLLPQSLSGGQAQSTFNDLLLRDLGVGRRLPQDFSTVLGKTEIYFFLNVLWAAPTTAGGWRKGPRQTF